MTHHYPTYAELRAMGITLQRDVSLWSARLAAEYRSPPTHSFTRAQPDPVPEHAKPPVRKHRKQETGTPAPTPHQYASAYKGVSTAGSAKFRGVWLSDGKVKTGRWRPNSEDGQRWAAQDRARALGVEYLEMRDGTRIPYLWKAYEEMAA